MGLQLKAPGFTTYSVKVVVEGVDGVPAQKILSIRVDGYETLVRRFVTLRRLIK